MTAGIGPVMVGHDGSTQAADALVLGRLLAQATGAGLVVARVFPVSPWHADHELPRGRVERARAAEEELVKELDEVAAAAGATAEPVPARSAAQGLHDLAEELDASAVVVGSAHTASFGSVLLGSTGERLLNGSPCPVSLAPQGLAQAKDPGLRTIGVAYDGLPESRRALELGTEVARRAEAAMRVLTVETDYTTGAEDVDAELLQGDPAEALGEAARDLDLLVLGSRGYGPFGRVLLGGVSLALVRMAPSALLIVPRGASG